ncbi:hypothetical protein E2C01_057636 [Portunus trituberculatus]|uniref:Uncharacterized protein n=1 Tax=Portunus trituberculatus TaxID=210409 RepID=A0A5B7H351_PORTR|nr:hypothetical protein [Portunus trituberculatus]
MEHDVVVHVDSVTFSEQFYKTPKGTSAVVLVAKATLRGGRRPTSPKVRSKEAQWTATSPEMRSKVTQWRPTDRCKNRLDCP